MMIKYLKLKWMYLFSSLVFFAPVSLLLRTSKGITLNEFFMLQASLSLMILLLEVPTGFIADHLGYKKTMILSKLLLFITRILFLIANSFWIFFIEVIVEAFSICFDSGTTDSYLYNLLDKKEYELECAKISNYATTGFIISTLLFPLIYAQFQLEGLILCTAMSSLISFIFTCLIDDVSLVKKHQKSHFDLSLLKSPCTLLIIANQSVITLAFLIINFFYVTKLKSMNIDIKWMSILILLYSSIQLTSPLIIQQFKKISNPIKLICISLIVCLSFLSIHLLSHLWIVSIMVCIPTLLAIWSIYIEKYANQFIDTIHQQDKRAMLLSIFNMGSSMVEVVFLGLSATSTTPLPFLFMAGCLLIIMFINIVYKTPTHYSN